MTIESDSTSGPPDRWADAAAISIGVLMTLCVSGYQFGRGNLTVYLLDGLRATDPNLFKNDWFVTSTLQYHAIFTQLTAALMRWNILEPAFLIGYVLLAILWHIAWLLIARTLGASRLVYLTSVLLYYISAAGISLGVYQFLQDACFLPGNIAAIAMLWGIYFWITSRRALAGLCLGIAALFHLNFAVVALGLWLALIGWELLRDRRARNVLPTIFGSLLLIAPAAFNVWNAIKMKLREGGAIPLDQFVALYIHFRHTHHFDPLGWPIALWIAFLWPIPFAIVAWKQSARDQQIARIFLIILGLQVVSFVFAGIFFVSESLVQMAFWRFSIYVKLLSCIGAATILSKRRWVLAIAPAILILAIAVTLRTSRGDVLRAHIWAVAMFALLSFAPAIVSISHRANRFVDLSAVIGCLLVAAVFWNRLGFGMTPELVDADYLDVCHWAREASPVDAVFLVPPGETAFRLEAQRAVVVNFKHVPQLAGEIVAWRNRLCDVLGTEDLTIFPHDYRKLLDALDAKYESRSAERLDKTANDYLARFIIVDHELKSPKLELVHRSANRRYFVYDRGS